MEQLTEIEARVLGALIEKSLTTPELYPLTMNALVNACNQKSSRDPVMQLDEAAAGRGLFTLLERGFAGRLHVAGTRVPKFDHRADSLLGTADPKIVATICVLLLRGPQTPGEIKTRTERLCTFESTAEVESLLQQLSTRPEGPFVAKLPRQPGQKESRYRHLFSAVSPEAQPQAPEPRPAAEPTASPSAAEAPDRVGVLEKRVAALEAALQAVRERLNKPA